MLFGRYLFPESDERCGEGSGDAVGLPELRLARGTDCVLRAKEIRPIFLSE